MNFFSTFAPPWRGSVIEELLEELKKAAKWDKIKKIYEFYANMAWYPSGKGMVCKTIIRGFDPHPRLKNEQEETSIK